MAAAKKAAAAKASTEPQEPLCTVPGCDNPVLQRGLCTEHWEAGEPPRLGA